MAERSCRTSFVVIVSAAMLLVNPSLAQIVSLDGSQRTKPTPQKAIEAILRAFDDYPVVALPEKHWNQQISDFRIALVRDPRFAEKVNDIVVEFGTARYQAVMDRYIGGEEVPIAQVRHAWRDTTQFFTWDPPIYEQFFKTLRAINQKLPRQRRLRVLLADPPVDWHKVVRREDWFALLRQRDPHAAEVVEKEVLSKGRKALLLFGYFHLVRRNPFQDYPVKPQQPTTMMEYLESRHPGTIFHIFPILERAEFGTLGADSASWFKPSLVCLKGTSLGALPVNTVYIESWDRYKALADGSVVVREGYSPDPTLEEMYDALLYLAPVETMRRAPFPSPKIYREGSYFAELKQRVSIANPYDLYRVEMAPKEWPSRRKAQPDDNPLWTQTLRAALNATENDAAYVSLATPQYRNFLRPNNRSYWEDTPGDLGWRRTHFTDSSTITFIAHDVVQIAGLQKFDAPIRSIVFYKLKTLKDTLYLTFFLTEDNKIADAFVSRQ